MARNSVVVDERIAELKEQAAEDGITLPMSPEKIAALEDQGHVVDLITGQVIEGGADLFIDSKVFTLVTTFVTP